MGLIFIRVVIIFSATLLVMRLMGKRQIGEMQPYELVITLIIADLACIPMGDTSIPLLYGVVAILTVYLLHQIICLIDLNFSKAKALISGAPSIVLNKNGIDDTQLKKNNLDVSSIVLACNHLSQSYTGALIVVCKTNPLEQIIQTGDMFESDINSQLLETIFFKNTPLHDGAVVIKDNKILAARCILPVSKNNNIPASMGLRHRSAIGITETTDAISVIVSEQTGKISVVKQGLVRHGISIDELQTYLDKEFNS